MCVNKDPEICSLCGGCAKPIHCVPVDSGEEIPWEELEDNEPILTEEMISNVHEFNNCGSFTLTYKGEAYHVMFDHGEITTEFPWPDAVRRFWYMEEEMEAQYSFQKTEV